MTSEPTPVTTAEAKPSVRQLPRNVWAVSVTSFLMDVSSEMVINILPLFLANVLGVKPVIIGVIDGVAEAMSSVLKLFSGWLSDKMHARKSLAVIGYALSALTKPFFYFATSWEMVAGVRWLDRVGKGLRTAPRDALIADSIDPKQRGLAFGFHRAADTAGAFLGVLIALLIVWLVQATDPTLEEQTFRSIVLISFIPAALSVFTLFFGAKDVPVKTQRAAPKFAFRSLGKPFIVFMIIVGVFTLGNSSDAFLILRAQNLGLSVLGVLGMMATFNLVYALVSTPAGSLSDRIGRRKLIIGGWLLYAAIYLGFGLAQAAWQAWALMALYGAFYGMAYGAANALIADLVPENLRGTAYGSYNAMIGLLAVPASVIAGALWQGVGAWSGFGPSAPFIFGGTLALIAALLMAFWLPRVKNLPAD
jgi:MFS family permease